MSRDRAPWETAAPPPPPPPEQRRAEDRAEKAEQAAIRRRWITLGEVLAVIAAVISALTFWNSYTERSHGEAERAAASASAARASATLVLKATLSKNGDRLDLAPVAEDQAIQSQRILFGKASGLAPIDTTGDARIEAGWIDDAVKKAAHGRDHRLPVAIVTRFVAGDGDPVETAALYHLGYRVEGRLFGSAVELTGLSLVSRTQASRAQAALNALK